MLNLTGSIKQIKSHINASDDAVQLLTLEVFGDFSGLHELMKKPLKISLEEVELT